MQEEEVTLHCHCWTFDIINIRTPAKQNVFDVVKGHTQFICWFTYTNAVNNPETGMAFYSAKGYCQFKQMYNAQQVTAMFMNVEGLHVVSAVNRPDLVLSLLKAPHAIEIHHEGIPLFTIEYDSQMDTLRSVSKGKHLLKKALKKIKPYAKAYGVLIMDEAVRVAVREIGSLLNVDLQL